MPISTVSPPLTRETTMPFTGVFVVRGRFEHIPNLVPQSLLMRDDIAAAMPCSSRSTTTSNRIARLELRRRHSAFEDLVEWQKTLGLQPDIDHGTCLSVIFTTVPVTTDFIGRQILRRQPSRLPARDRSSQVQPQNRSRRNRARATPFCRKLFCGIGRGRERRRNARSDAGFFGRSDVASSKQLRGAACRSAVCWSGVGWSEEPVDCG